MKGKKTLTLTILTLIFIEMIFFTNVFAIQDDEDNEVTLHCRLDTNSAEIHSNLMTPGTYDFYETPSLDIGTFSHDISNFEISNIQEPSFNQTNTQENSFVLGVNATAYSNNTFNHNESIPQYSIDNNFDTIINLNLNYTITNETYLEGDLAYSEDFSSNYWDLSDATSRTFGPFTTPEQEPYLMGNVTIDSYSLNASYSVSSQSASPNGGFFHDGYWYVLDYYGKVYKYYQNWTYTNSNYSASVPGPQDIYFHDGYWYVLDYIYGRAYKYHENWTSTGQYYSLGGTPRSIAFYDGYWWVLKESTRTVCKYYENWTSTGDSYWVGIDSTPRAIDYYGNSWYFVGHHNRKIYRFTTSWSYTGTSWSVPYGTEDVRFHEDRLYFVIGEEADKTVRKYDNDLTVSKNFHNVTGDSVYMQTNENETISLISPVHSDLSLNYSDRAYIEFQTNTTNQVNISFVNDGAKMHEIELLPTGNANFSKQILDVYICKNNLIFDQIKISANLEDTNYFELYDIKIYNFNTSATFTNAYIENFTYNVLGLTYYENFTLTPSNDNPSIDNFTVNLVFSFDSTQFSNRSISEDLTIPSQNATLILYLAGAINMSFSSWISYSSSLWKTPSESDLEINDIEVIDETYNSGYLHLTDYSEILTITSNLDIYFTPNISIYFSFSFSLDVISKTYLKKRFKLLSDHNIYIERIDLDSDLLIRKLYINNEDLGYDNPNYLSPNLEMVTGNIYTLEVILTEELYLPLAFVMNSLGQGTSNFFLRGTANTLSYNDIDKNIDFAIHIPTGMLVEYSDLQFSDLKYTPYYVSNSSESRSGLYAETQSYSNENVEWSQKYSETSQNGYKVSENSVGGYENVYSEDFSSENSQMDHNYYPDNHNSTYSVSDDLSMYNEFPNEFHEDDFSDYSHYYNSTYIDSTWSNGNLSSQVIEGHYPGTYSFDNDAVGSNPSGWSLYYIVTGFINVIGELDGHRKILDINDMSAGGIVSATNTFASQTSGTIEMWVRGNNLAKEIQIRFYEGPTIVSTIGLAQDELRVYNGDWTSICSLSNNEWYHLSYQFDSTADLITVRLNGTEVFHDSTIDSDSINKLVFYTNDTEWNYHYYIDAIGYSWDEDYTIGDNYYYNHYAGTEDFESYNVSTYGDYYGSYSFTNDPVSESGYYYSSPDSFNDESVGTSGTDIAFVDDATLYDGNATIISEYQGHKNVLNLTDDITAGEDPKILHNFVQSISGDHDFWIATSDVSKHWIFQLYDAGVGTQMISLRILSGILEYRDDIDYHTIQGVANDNWYHFRCVWRDDDTYDVYLNGSKVVDNVKMATGQGSGIYKLRVLCSGDSTASIYLDAYGESEDALYTIGDNYNPYGLTSDVSEFVNAYLNNFNCSVSVVSELDGHDKVLNITDYSNNGATYVREYFSESRTTGTVEFWVYSENYDKAFYTYLYDVSGYKVATRFNGNTAQYYNGTDWLYINAGITLTNEHWYHVKIVFDSDADIYDYYVNGTLFGNDLPYKVAGEDLESLYFASGSSVYGSDYKYYFDAIGYSWDENYNVGDNINPYGKLSSLDANWDFDIKPYTSLSVYGDFNSHKKTLKLFDNSTSTLSANYDFAYKYYGTIEYWFKTTDVNKTSKHYLCYSTGSVASNLWLDNGIWYYYTPATGTIPVPNVPSPANNTWYHIRLDFECTIGGYKGLGEDQWIMYGNGISSGMLNFQADFSKLYYLDFRTWSTDENYSLFVDSLSCSWDSNYIENMSSYLTTRFLSSQNSTISRDIDFSFLNRYDSGYNPYQKLYNITIQFQYKFTQNDTYLNCFDPLFNSSSLTNDGNWHSYLYSFIFNSTNLDSFNLLFNISNGLLELKNMNYTIWFECLDLSDRVVLYQNFSLTPEFSLDYLQQTRGNWILNFSVDFTESSDLFDYYNSINNSQLFYNISIEHESGINNYYYNTNSSLNQEISFNITNFLSGLGKSQFLNFSISFFLAGNSSSVDIDNLTLYDFDSDFYLVDICSISDNFIVSHQNYTLNFKASDRYISHIIINQTYDANTIQLTNQSLSNNTLHTYTNYNITVGFYQLELYFYDSYNNYENWELNFTIVSTISLSVGYENPLLINKNNSINVDIYSEYSINQIYYSNSSNYILQYDNSSYPTYEYNFSFNVQFNQSQYYNISVLAISEDLDEFYINISNLFVKKIASFIDILNIKNIYYQDQDLDIIAKLRDCENNNISSKILNYSVEYPDSSKYNYSSTTDNTGEISINIDFNVSYTPGFYFLNVSFYDTYQYLDYSKLISFEIFPIERAVNGTDINLQVNNNNVSDNFIRINSTSEFNISCLDDSTFDLSISIILNYTESVAYNEYLDYSFDFEATSSITSLTFSNASLLDSPTNFTLYYYDLDISTNYNLTGSILTINDLINDTYYNDNDFQLQLRYYENSIKRTQITSIPRTDTDSVVFSETLIANRSFDYWYYYSSLEVNDLSLYHQRTAAIINNFETVNATDNSTMANEPIKYYFEKESNSNDIFTATVDYNPNWVVSYSIANKTKTSCYIAVNYKADLEIDDVSIVLTIQRSDLFTEISLNNNQNNETLTLIVEGISFNTTLQTLYLSGVRTQKTTATKASLNSVEFTETFIYRSTTILESVIDVNPNYYIDYEIQTNNGTYSKLKIDYKADLDVDNVNISLDLLNDALYNENWTNSGEQNSANFKLIIPGFNFNSILKSFYIEGYSSIPYCLISAFESDQNSNQITTNSEIDFAAFLSYPKFSQAFMLNTNENWTNYNIYYGKQNYSIQSISGSLIKFESDGFDPSVKNSYLHFSTKPFSKVDWDYTNDVITITIESSLTVDNAYFIYSFDPTSSHTLELTYNDTNIYELSDSGDYDGFLRFRVDRIEKGTTIIKIVVNFATPLEIAIQFIFIFAIMAALCVSYYYFKTHDEARKKILKVIDEKVIDKLKKIKDEKEFNRVELEVKNNKISIKTKK